MTMTVSQFREQAADREAIKDCLWRYTRGIDRVDEAMLRSAYWPDATDDHGGLYTGPASEFIDQAMRNMPSAGDTVHIVSNILIRIDGATAKVESYVYAIQCMPGETGTRDVLTAARYLDRFEKRHDEWRIAERTVAVDWFREYPDSCDWSIGPFGLGEASRGRKGPEDRSHSWLGLR